MALFLTISQIVLAVLLIISVLLQQKGAGLSGVFGGGDTFYSAKRGADKILFQITIVVSTLFILSGILDVIFS